MLYTCCIHAMHMLYTSSTCFIHVSDMFWDGKEVADDFPKMVLAMFGACFGVAIGVQEGIKQFEKVCFGREESGIKYDAESHPGHFPLVR